MFQLTREEVGTLNRSQFVTGSQKHRDPRYPPYTFTEHGVAMLSSVLNSDRAIEINILIMRAFGRLRDMVASHKNLARQLPATGNFCYRLARYIAGFDVINVFTISSSNPCLINLRDDSMIFIEPP